ncbi:MAG: hypothetical protein F6J97_02920 [Leptolyngbya sp. SIO4C1]|nr:hypothetical protein [Leptolyngbya sp. SIO4C1]
MTSLVKFHLSIQDEQASDVELQKALYAVAAELEKQSAQVASVPSPTLSSDFVAMGGDIVSLLNVEINPDTLKAFGRWLYERLLGTSTKVKFEYEGIVFEFEGRSNRDRQSAMQDFEQFIAKIEAAKRS